MNEDLKAAVEAMYRMALEGCQTFEESNRVLADLRHLIWRLEDVSFEGYSKAINRKERT
jgi:hypothetical protein